mgnify:CR=1 FL=1
MSFSVCDLKVLYMVLFSRTSNRWEVYKYNGVTTFTGIDSALKVEEVLENIGFKAESSSPDYADGTITENTRVSYPIHFIDNVVVPSIGGAPKNIFFLTADAFGVLPPISKLTAEQAMYHFISGYTAKVAGTEAGVTEPQTTFSACFGKVFLPLHPAKYAEMLGKKMKESKGIKDSFVRLRKLGHIVFNFNSSRANNPGIKGHPDWLVITKKYNLVYGVKIVERIRPPLTRINLINYFIVFIIWFKFLLLGLFRY